MEIELIAGSILLELVKLIIVNIGSCNITAPQSEQFCVSVTTITTIRNNLRSSV